MMRLLREPGPLTAKFKVQCDEFFNQGPPRKKPIINYFYRYAYDSESQSQRDLSLADLLEYLKRIVFKGACIISNFHQKQEKTVPALNAYLEELKFEWPDQDEDVQNRGANYHMGVDGDSDDVEIRNLTHDQLLDFKIRQCLGKQNMRKQGEAEQYHVDEWETQQFAPPTPEDQ